MSGENVADTPELYRPRYDLTEDDARALAGEILSDLPPSAVDSPSPFICVELEPESKLGNACRYVEEKVFVEEFGNTPQEMDQEYGPYEAASRMWVVIDKARQLPIGALRAIEDSPNGLKTLNDIQRGYLHIPTKDVQDAYELDISKTWDVGTVAVLPEYRGTEYNYLPSLVLYRSLYARAVDFGVDHFVSIIDKKARANLDLLGMTFKPILDSPEFLYLGSDKSAALITGVAEVAQGVQDKMAAVQGGGGLKALIYRSGDALYNGTGVDDIRVMPAASQENA